VVVDGLVASVDVGENCDVLPGACIFDVEKVCGDDVEVLRVEFDQGFEVCCAYAVVAQLVRVRLDLGMLMQVYTDLVDCSRSWLEPLEFANAWFLGFVIDFEDFGIGPWSGWSLSEKQIYWKAFRVRQRHHMASTGSIRELFDIAGCR
jgi:hypothetical protein